MNVVIAEDDYRVSMIHEQYLNGLNGFSIVGKALNGKELRRYLQNHTVDLILLDLYFPDERGTTLLKNIRYEYPEIDIIIISASDARSDLLIAKRHGAYHFLVKPISMEQFQLTLKEYRSDRLWFYEESMNFAAKDARRFLTSSVKDHFSNLENQLPSGIDAITLEKVADALRLMPDGLTIEDTCQRVGISRTTARRYLEHLVASSEATTKLNYGVIGRPERKYVSKSCE